MHLYHLLPLWNENKLEVINLRAPLALLLGHYLQLLQYIHRILQEDTSAKFREFARHPTDIRQGTAIDPLPGEGVRALNSLIAYLDALGAGVGADPLGGVTTERVASQIPYFGSTLTLSFAPTIETSFSSAA